MVPFDWVYLSWALALGTLTAFSLIIGSVLGITVDFKQRTNGILAAFGAGALLAALALELIAPTVSEMLGHGGGHSGGHGGGKDFVTLWVLLSSCIAGGLIFVVLDQIVNTKGGFLRKQASIINYFTKAHKEEMHQVLRDLSKVPILRSVPKGHIQDLVNWTKSVNFGDGETIFSQEDRGDCMYFVRNGTIELEREGKPFRELGEGEILGEIALLTGAPRTASARAKGDVEVLRLSKEDFDFIRKQSDEFDKAARQLASGRLEEIRKEQASEFAKVDEWTKDASTALHTGTTLPSAQQLHKESQEHSGAPLAIWLGILLDGLPESLVIGITFNVLINNLAAQGQEIAFSAVIPYTLIAGLFLSNFPEALSSSAGMRKQGWSALKIILLWSSIVVITAAGAAIGYVIAESLSHHTVVGIEGIAAGAMLTMIASAMLPEAVHLAKPNLVGLSTLVGFLSAIAFKTLE